MRNKFRNIAMISFLAIAGIFGVSSALINKQVEEKPVVEKAKAATDASHVVYFTRPSYADNGSGGTSDHGVYIHYYGGGYDTWVKMEWAFQNSSSQHIYKSTVPAGVTNIQFQFHQWDKYSNPWVYRAKDSTEDTPLPTDDYTGYYNNEEWYYDKFHVSTWTVHPLTISYNSNGGTSGTMSDQEIYGDVDNTPSTNAFTRSNWIFKGWNTKADGTGTSISVASGSLSKAWGESQTPGSTITLYAQWTQYTIIWYTGTGSQKGFTTAYIWNTGNSDKNADWPGVGGSTLSGYDNYYYQIVSFLPNRVIFNNGNSGYDNQTGDYTIPGEEYLHGSYYYDTSTSKEYNADNWKRLTHSVTITEGEGVSSVFLSLDDDATSGASSDTAFNVDSIVYGYAVVDASSGYGPAESWTLISGNIYRVGSITVTISSSDFGTVNATSGESAAITYATEFNSAISSTCNYDGGTNQNSLNTAWQIQGGKYNSLESYVKYWLTTGYDPADSDSNIKAMIAKYDYVVGKYESAEVVDDYLSRNPEPLSSIRNFTIDNIFGSEDSASTIIIIIASSVALLSVTALSILVLKKRRREQE